MNGKFIVIYGANNLGKSLQIKLLTKYCVKNNIPHKTIKYLIYDLEPNGPLLNSILRKHTLSHFSEIEIQKIFAKNRSNYEPILSDLLERGINVIAEDYTGTGIAWGMVRGARLTDLENINKGCRKEDYAILLYGKRFMSGKESNHKNEDDMNIWENSQKKHLALADRYQWHTIHATQLPQTIHRKIVEYIFEK